MGGGERQKGKEEVEKWKRGNGGVERESGCTRERKGKGYGYYSSGFCGKHLKSSQCFGFTHWWVHGQRLGETNGWGQLRRERRGGRRSQVHQYMARIGEWRE
jgi:hypothetical protein